jgi:hypothetical protein
MKEIFVALGFITMVLSPCFVAMKSQLHHGTDDFYNNTREYEEEDQ